MNGQKEGGWTEGSGEERGKEKEGERTKMLSANSFLRTKILLTKIPRKNVSFGY